MSITVSAKVTGSFDGIAAALQANAERLVTDTLTVVEAIDRQLCPVDPNHDPKDGPHLKDTIRQDRKDPYQGDVVEGEGTQGQGVFTEYGTHHVSPAGKAYAIPAQPHQTPAADIGWRTTMAPRIGKLLGK